ncbi:MAG TPA: hypothetical protein PLU61_09220, partial [Rhodoglobus sp.]|nr:hypothetical protein [Rhodoglobus sp.]
MSAAKIMRRMSWGPAAAPKCIAECRRGGAAPSRWHYVIDGIECSIAQRPESHDIAENIRRVGDSPIARMLGIGGQPALRTTTGQWAFFSMLSTRWPKKARA